MDENLLSWRKNENSLSSSIKQKLFDGFKVYNKYMNFNFLTSLYYLFILSINFYFEKYENQMIEIVFYLFFIFGFIYYSKKKIYSQTTLVKNI